MKYRNILALTILSFSALMFNGCGKDASTTEPVISDAVEETESIEDVEETDEIVEPIETGSKVIDTEENDVSDNDSDNGISGTGEDTKTDEEIEAELEEIPTEQADPSTSTDGKYDGGGVNLETGEYDPYHDTNNGQGWDINGEHFDTWGEHQDALRAKASSITVEEEFEWWTPDQGPLTPNN